MTGHLIPMADFISMVDDWYTDQQKKLIEHHMLQYKADMRRHDPAARHYRLRRHWGPARLTARRERIGDR